MAWLTYSLSSLDESMLRELAQLRSREERNFWNALYYAMLYPLWYLRKSRYLFAFKDSVNQKLVLKLPKLRAFRKHHYSWIKHLRFPSGRRWVLITLTFKRDIPLQHAWCYVNSWTSLFLKRLRDYVWKMKKVRISYLWVVESHEDGYPHVHVLVSFPFVSIDKVISWWADHHGNPLSEPQGVDLRFIGSFENVKNYVVKYLVKGHGKYWSFYRNGDVVKVRLATLFIWYFRVKLFGMSRDIRRPRVQSSSDFAFVGLVSLFALWYDFYRDYNISPSVLWQSLMDGGGIEKDIAYLSYLHVFRPPTLDKGKENQS